MTILERKDKADLLDAYYQMNLTVPEIREAIEETHGRSIDPGAGRSA